MLAPLLALVLAAQPTAPQRLLGAWDFGQDGEGAPACRIRLDAAPVIGGFRLLVPAACRKVSPRAGDLYAWYLTPQGKLNFADVTRHAVIIFEPHDPGTWSTAIGVDPAYLLNRAR